jgi:D-galactarolactone cycloisomerase
MKIRDVRVAGLRGATPKGGWTIELKPDDVVHTLLAVHTDDGVVGIGSVFSSERLVRAAIDEVLPLLLAENPLEPERVSEKLHQNTFWLGRGGAITHAISGINIALWDILGQVTGQPVGRLLGGRYRDRVMPYASVLMDEPGRMTAELAELRGAGFRAYKIGWGPFGRVGPDTDEKIVAAARAAVGDDALLAVDAGGSDAYWPNDYKWALRTARMLEQYRVAWFEEALVPDDIEEFAALRRASLVPISGGETLTRRQSFGPYLRAGSLDIFQPDVTKVGGLSEVRRLGWMAEEAGAKLIPHGWNTAIGLAADLQLASALPGTDLVEYRTGSAYIDELAAGGWELDADGMLPIPAAPGLGLQLDPEALCRYAGDASLVNP